MDKLTITDRFIFSYINSFSKNRKPVFASNKHISEQINKSESVVSHSISRLLNLGFIENKGNKYARQLYTKKELVTADYSILNADFNLGNAENNQSIVENSISLDEIKRVIAENSDNETLKIAITNAENSYILIKILLSYTNKKDNIYNIRNFKKPNIEEIKAYCQERKNFVDANRFYDYYESNGWKIGKNKMKDWKAAVRTWEKNNDKKTNSSKYLNNYGSDIPL